MYSLYLSVNVTGQRTRHLVALWTRLFGALSQSLINQIGPKFRESTVFHIFRPAIECVRMALPKSSAKVEILEYNFILSFKEEIFRQSHIWSK
jgi:hypothetical protein